MYDSISVFNEDPIEHRLRASDNMLLCHDLAFHEPFSTFHGGFIPYANQVIP
jgi:hypothetical protein